SRPRALAAARKPYHQMQCRHVRSLLVLCFRPFYHIFRPDATKNAVLLKKEAARSLAVNPKGEHCGIAMFFRRETPSLKAKHPVHLPNPPGERDRKSVV